VTAVPATRGAATHLAVSAVDALQALGEEIEDELLYVAALAETGRRRLREVAGADADAPLDDVRGAAVVAACAEVARIADPHRAIDWLSTFPAVIELALARTPAPPGKPSAPSGAA
jgi:hypothetical protein